MTPEELEKMRKFVWQFYESTENEKTKKFAEDILDLFNHIDKQTKQIEVIDEQEKEISSLKNNLDNALSDLKGEKEHVEIMHLMRDNELRLLNEKCRQINILKDVIILFCQKEILRSKGANAGRRPYTIDWAKDEAKKQLKAKFPEVGWE